MARIARLCVYPVKGCRGIDLQQATVGETGLAHDREWMVVRPGGGFLSQREFPAMSLVRTRLGPESLHLSAPDIEPIDIPRNADAGRRQVTVWRDTLEALDAGDAPAHWLSAILGAEVRLVRFDPAVTRPCNPAYVGSSGAHTRFADGYPVLVIGEASLDELNGRLRQPLPMNRFRPNVVLAGLEPFDEDHLDTITVGGVRLRLVKPCTRCQVTTVDQDHGRVAGEEPLVTLSRYRNNPDLGGVAFGMNAIVEAGAGQTISEGDVAAVDFRF